MSDMTKLSKNASMYYVAGLSSTNGDSYKIPFSQMVSSIFGLDFDPSLTIMPNHSTPTYMDTDLKDKIMEIALENEQCNQVDLVWIAHSHGAKVVCDVYKELQDWKEFDRVKNRSAIVCVGGVSVATQDMAKVVLNVEFKNDNYSKSGAHLLRGDRDGCVLMIGPFEEGKCTCCSGTTPVVVTYEKVQKGMPEILCGFASSSNAISKHVLPSLQQLSETPDSAHLYEEYLLCKIWQKQLKELLAVAQCQ